MCHGCRCLPFRIPRRCPASGHSGAVSNFLVPRVSGGIFLRSLSVAPTKRLRTAVRLPDSRSTLHRRFRLPAPPRRLPKRSPFYAAPAGRIDTEASARPAGTDPDERSHPAAPAAACRDARPPRSPRTIGVHVTTHGYATRAPDARLEPFEFERRALRPRDVQIEIDHCGICHTDIHFARNDWGFTQYPCVPGHEIVGRVTAVGPEVKKHQVGDLVGVGCFVDSCGTCESCRQGKENHCEAGVLYTYSWIDSDGSVTMGGYSTDIVVDEHFVFRIPPGLDAAAAAPLLCAGITTYSPLRHLQVGEGDSIAILGLGGLGHMAVQFAAAMGAEVTVLSRSPEKATDAARLGAHDLVDTREADSLARHAGRFRYIIDTLAVGHDLGSALACLKPGGTLVMLGAAPTPLSLATVPLVFGRRGVIGSLVGGVPETQEMLDFCGARGIVSEIEPIAPTDINDAFERVLSGDVKYRFVIDCQQMRMGAEPVPLPV